MEITAAITGIQRYSVHDGPGIRTIVFFKGCPLHCQWCQNPETQSPNIEMILNPDLCIGCGSCEVVCPRKEAKPFQNGYDFNRSLCLSCGECQRVCFTEARKLNGKIVSLDQVEEEILRDSVFYNNSGGGVTVSGGEPLIHKTFVLQLFKRMKAHNINTAVETCGYVSWDNIKTILPYTDLFLYDIKAMDPATHKKYTGQNNDLIIQNFKRIRQAGADVIIRIPLIPDVNDNENMYRDVAKLAIENNVGMIHIMPFHQMGSSKWKGMGMNYKFENIAPLSMDRAEKAKKYFTDKGIEVHIFGY